MAAVTRWELQARAVVVRGGVLVRDETVVEGGESRPALSSRARELARAGYTAWIFERRGTDPVHPDLHLVETVTPPATRLYRRPR